MKAFKNYKKRITKLASDEHILNEIGYCYKRALISQFDKKDYWTKCYNFLKKLASKKNIKPLC